MVAHRGHGSVVERCFRMAQAAVRFRLAPGRTNSYGFVLFFYPTMDFAKAATAFRSSSFGLPL